MTTTETICSYCNGTGVDADFGGTCSGCAGGAIATTVPKTTEPTLDEMSALAIWLGEQTWSEFAQSLSSFYARKGYLSEKQLKAGLSMKAKMDAKRATEPAKPAKPAGAPVEAPGMFQRPDGVVFKVQLARTTGNLYAKRLLDEGGFEYAAGAMRTLTEPMRLTLDAAKDYGRRTGTCCCCGRTLTNPASIEAGIGPICAGGF